MVRSVRCPTLTATEIADLSQGSHAHGGSQLSITLSGTIFECVLGVQRPPGSVVYRPPGLPHRTEGTTDARLLLIEIPAERFAGINECIGGLFQGPALFTSAELGAYQDEVYSEVRRADLATPLLVEAKVLALIVRMAEVLRGRSGPSRPSWLEDAMRLLRAVPCRRFTVAGLAAEIGVSPRQLTDAIAQFERRPLRELALRARLDAARQVLLRTSRSITQIAADTGFADHAHFTNAFRRIYGVSPSVYRISRL